MRAKQIRIGGMTCRRELRATLYVCIRQPAGINRLETSLTKRFVGRVTIRLKHRFSQSRRHDLLAKFAEVGPQQGLGMGPIPLIRGREIELGMGPLQSTRDQTIVDVTHTRTIRNIIKSSVSSTPLPNPRFDETQWREPLFEVIFSIPQDAHGYVTDFTRWSLLSIKLPNAKKEQPKPSDK